MASDEEKLYYAGRLEAVANDVRYARSFLDWDTVLFKLDVLYRQVMMSLPLDDENDVLEMIVEASAIIADHYMDSEQVVDNNKPVGRPRLDIPMAQLEYFLGMYTPQWGSPAYHMTTTISLTPSTLSSAILFMISSGVTGKGGSAHGPP